MSCALSGGVLNRLPKHSFTTTPTVRHHRNHGSVCLQGKVILVESKKERKARAAMAVNDFKSKLTAERSKHSTGAASSATSSAASSPAKSVASSSDAPAASAKAIAPVTTSPPKKKPSQVQVRPAEMEVVAHTATFSTAPAPKRETSRDKPSSGSTSPRVVQSDDPFATGGDADDAHSDEEDDGDGDMGGDITSQFDRSRVADSDSGDEIPEEDDFAAMLAAADDLQAS